MRSERLKVYEAGPTTVVGFGGQVIVDDISVADSRDEILDVVRQHGAKVVAFDLTGVRLIPSGLLGLMASLRHLDLSIRVYNPSPEVREVLSVTMFDRLVDVREVDTTNV
ncbi:MAG: STAS domain-containing protein [Planctomycetaceae bacterium]|nr:STAS domain-containing protein [Planctomycetaceae bacterium]